MRRLSPACGFMGLVMIVVWANVSPAQDDIGGSPPSSPSRHQRETGVVPGMRAYVDGANTGEGHNGKTWATAFTKVQDALDAGAAEIWVAKGTYTPGRDRQAAFQLCTGGSLYGGFSGGEARRDQRDWVRNKTILDGDGAYHTVIGADGAVLDGFVICGGNGFSGEGGKPAGGEGGGPPGGGRPIHTTPQAILRGLATGSGGGMANFQVAPTVRNCIFEDNKAGKGGGVYNMTSTSFPPRPGVDGKVPVFVNCSFRRNFAHGRGGGVSNDLGTSPIFLNCVFEANETPQKGGGMYNDFGCSPTLINCLFTGNEAFSAAGMGNDGGSSPVMYHCTFTKNHARDCGSPLYQGTGPASNPSLIRCLITGNACDWEDPGIYNWHDNTPFIKESTVDDAGYQPDRFTESQLPRLLTYLRQCLVQPARGLLAAPPERESPSQRIVYVNAASTAAGDGCSWVTAFSSLSRGLEDADRDGAEVHVAAGTYKLSADRSISFVLGAGVRVYGGYASDGTERDSARNYTVLDGNHAYHVVIGANGAVLDGLTITGGYADGTGYDGKGGGLINYQRGPQGRPNSEVVTGFAMTISHCVFAKNYARDGGAVYSYDRAKPVFTKCVFSENRAENGGAVLDRVGVSSSFENCEFVGNMAHWRGGAVYFDYGSRPKLKKCVLRDNSTDGHGGAVFSVSRASQLENTIVTLADCRFEGNAARGNGGGAAFCDSSVGVVQNCTFGGNKAGKEGDDTYVDASSTTSADGDERPDSGKPPGGGAGFGEAGARAGGRIGGRTGGENLPAVFQPNGDFSVIIIGSGGPPYNPKRSGPSAAIQYHGRFILVDMGNGTQAHLYEAGISFALIDAFFVTHHHRDHDEEFMPMLNTALVRGLPLEIVGTPSTKRLADFTADFYAEDIAYRIERTGRSAKSIPKPHVREIQGGESFNIGDVQVKTARVPHSIHTVAYRFDLGSQSIVISGDLTYSDALISLAHNADVLVMDSGASVVRPGLRRPADGAARHDAAHASAEEVAQMAEKAGAKKLVLTHIVPFEVDEESTVNSVGQVYKGQVVVSHDLLEVVPGKTKDYDHRAHGENEGQAQPPTRRTSPAAGPVGGFRLIPRYVVGQLDLSDAQWQKIAALEKVTKAELYGILTPQQQRILEETRPPRPDQGSPVGPGNARPWRGPGRSEP
jgi:ribonuclease BN (tRNA processing enzyme)